jgi:predicted nucleotidyltransferase
LPSARALAKILDLLGREGISGVLVGSTALQLAAGMQGFEGDVDLFVTSTSVLANLGIVEEFVRRYGCLLGSTWVGTPSITCYVDGEEVVVDLYENMHDFYIPNEILEDSVEYEVQGIRVRAVRPEDYLVLKAVSSAMEDPDVVESLRGFLRSKRIKLNRRLIESRLQLFEDPQAIMRRLGELIR